MCGKPVCAKHAWVYAVKIRGRWREGQTRSRYLLVRVMHKRDCHK